MILARALICGLGVALLGALVLAGGQCSQKQAAQLELQTKLREHAETLANIAALARRAAEKVAAREGEMRTLLDASNKAREEGIANAVESQQKLVADLRAGNVRLREQWAGCRSEVPGDGASGLSADDAADLRAADSGRLVRTGDDADIQIRGLQDYARACQALTKDED